MARALLIPNPENATIEELKQVARVGSIETAIRCSAIQMLLAGADRPLVCSSVLVTDRALRKWINAFNTSGADGLIVNKRPGRMAIIKDQQAIELSELIDQPQVLFGLPKPFMATSVSSIKSNVAMGLLSDSSTGKALH